MTLVEVVFLGEDRKEKVALDVVLGDGLFVEDTLGLIAVQFLIADVGAVCLQEQDGLTVVRWYEELEVPAVFGLHLHGGHIVLEHQLALDGHLVLQSAAGLIIILSKVLVNYVDDIILFRQPRRRAGIDTLFAA